MAGRIKRICSITQGEPWSLTFTVVDGLGEVVSLAGASTKAFVKEKDEDTDAAAIVEITVTIAAPATGVIVLSLTGAQTKALSIRTYYFDIFVDTTTALDGYPFGGTLKVKRPITRSL